MLISRKMMIMLALLACCSGSGCWAFYTTLPAEVVLTATDSGKPLADYRVSVRCVPDCIFIGAPGTSGTTDERGHAILAVPDMEQFPRMRLEVNCNSFYLDRDTVSKGGVLAATDSRTNISVRLLPRPKDPIWFLFHKHGVYATVGAL